MVCIPNQHAPPAHGYPSDIHMGMRTVTYASEHRNHATYAHVHTELIKSNLFLIPARELAASFSATPGTPHLRAEKLIERYRHAHQRVHEQVRSSEPQVVQGLHADHLRDDELRIELLLPVEDSAHGRRSGRLCRRAGRRLA